MHGKMVHLIGLISSFITLVGVFLSVVAPFPLWAPVLMCLSNAGFVAIYRQSKGMIWFIISLSQSITCLAGNYLYSQWGDSRWAFLMVKFPVLILLIVSWLSTLIFWRLYGLSSSSTSPNTNRNKSFIQSILQLFKKKEEPKNALTFVLGEKAD